MFRFYGKIQKLKYLFDKIYHFINKDRKKPNVQDNFSNRDKIFEYIKDKKLILLKSCLSYPSKDGLTNQYYSFFNYFCSNNEHKAYLFCKKDFEEQNFLNNLPKKQILTLSRIILVLSPYSL